MTQEDTCVPLGNAKWDNRRHRGVAHPLGCAAIAAGLSSTHRPVSRVAKWLLTPQSCCWHRWTCHQDPSRQAVSSSNSSGLCGRYDSFFALPFIGLSQKTPDVSLATWIVWSFVPPNPCTDYRLKNCTLTRRAHTSSQVALHRGPPPGCQGWGDSDSLGTAEAQVSTEKWHRSLGNTVTLQELRQTPTPTKARQLKSSLERRKKMICLRSLANMEGMVSWNQDPIPVKPSLAEEVMEELSNVQGQSTSIQGKGTQGTKQGCTLDSVWQCSFWTTVMKMTTKEHKCWK